MAAFTELIRSRWITRGPQTMTLIRSYHGLKADLTMGADGWTGNGFDLPGTVLNANSATTIASWTDSSYTMPVVDRIELDPRTTPAEARINVVYIGYRKWA